MPQTPEQPDKPKLMKISDAAKAARVSKQTVEYYILLGLIEPIRDEDGHARWFDESLVRRIRLIKDLNKSGYTLQGIRETYQDRLRDA